MKRSMFRTLFRTLAAVCLAVLVALAVASCSEETTKTITEPVGTGSVIFNLDHTVGGTPLVLGAGAGYPYTNASGNQYNVTEIFYYTCNFRVHMADGSSYGTDAVHYRDATDDNTRGFELTDVPEGVYTAVSFTFGLDPRRNVTDALLPDFDQIPWPSELGGGYHYMMMNGNWDNGGSNNVIRVHTGRRYITANPGPANAVPPGPDAIPHHHHFEVYLTLATPLTVMENQTWAVPIELDINGWFQSPPFDFNDWFTTDDMTSMIMPKLPAQDLLLQNGIAGSLCSVGTPVMQ